MPTAVAVEVSMWRCLLIGKIYCLERLLNDSNYWKMKRYILCITNVLGDKHLLATDGQLDN